MNKNDFYNLLEKSDLEVKLIDGTIKCSNNFNTIDKRSNLITVYDIEKRSIRHFYEDSIISVRNLDTTYQLLQE